MAELFDIYEDSLRIVLKNVREGINKDNPNENDLELLHTNIAEAKRIIRQIDIEISSNKSEISQSAKVKYRNYSNEINELNKKYLKLQDAYIKKKNKNILAFDAIDVSSNRKIQKMSLIENEQGDSIDEMRIKTTQIEKMGKQISSAIVDQGDQMKSIRDNITGLNNEIDDSSNIITKMLKKENRNKIILFSAVFVIFALFLIVLYYKFKK